MKDVFDFKDLTPVIAAGGEIFGSALSDLRAGADADLRFGCLNGNGRGESELPAAMVVLVRSGSLTLSGEDRTLVLAAGDAAAVGKETALRWEAEAAEMVVVCDYRAEVKPELAELSLSHPLSPSSGPATTLLRSSAPECASHGFRVEGEFTFGLWSATPYERAPTSYGYSELMYLLDGAVNIYTEAGESQRFEAGDVFIILAGAKLGWRSDVFVRKLWVISSRA
jgi:uncharacterized cupin superfamily protein